MPKKGNCVPLDVKICGLSTVAALDAAVAGGARHAGFIFFAKSPRHLDADQAAALIARLPAATRAVGVFVDPDPAYLATVMGQARFDVIQLHGNESPEFAAALAAQHGVEVWKAIPVKTRADLEPARRYVGAVSRILYDAKTPVHADLPGGMGLRFDWQLLAGHHHPLPWILAGGIDAGNIAEAAATTGATMIDVSSGVESAPGLKDVDKIAALLKAASL